MPLTKGNVHFNENKGKKISAHEVDLNSFTNPPYRPWVTKKNKHQGKEGEDASKLEVAFSTIASLFLRSGLTPTATLVYEDDEDNVFGVASENFNVKLKELTDNNITCYAFSPGDTWQYTSITNEDPTSDEIEKEKNKLNSSSKDVPFDAATVQEKLLLDRHKKGVNFLDKMPKKFIPNLMEKHNNGEVVVDMDSLACILAGSYMLEEDDLHKGNIGFYVTDTDKDDPNNPGEKIKKFTFFKIDHDLMLNNSIMSKKDMRLANILYGKNAFHITARDLDDFPDLKDSGNHYWPTKKRMIATGDKSYKNKREREAFADLKKNEDFKNAKWKYFLKFSLMPIELVEQSLQSELDPVKDLDKINMVKNAIGSRIVELKRVLMESPEFMAYLRNKDTAEVIKTIRDEIKEQLKNSNIPDHDQESISRRIDEIVQYAQVETSKMSKTILFDCYEFSYNDKNREKPTEVDLEFALQQFELYKESNDSQNAYKHACILEDLLVEFLKDASKETKEDYSKIVDSIKLVKQHYTQSASITTLKQFREAAAKISASNLPLKQQKIEILAVLKEADLPAKDLKKLKKQLEKKEPDYPELKFIKQLRSELWVVRKMFGTYNTTTTSKRMLDEIDSKEVKLKKSCVSKAKIFKEMHGRIKKDSAHADSLTHTNETSKTPGRF